MLVVGLNHSIDSAACIVRDGEVLAAAQEERFTRVKHDRGFPWQALRFCLRRAGATLGDVDAVGFFWNPGLHAQTFSPKQSSLPRHHMEFLYSVPNHLLRALGDDMVAAVEQIFRMASGRRLVVHYVTHHLAHAASTLFRAPFSQTAILTVDGYGERASTHIAVGRDATIETLRTIDFPHSVGSLYAAVTEHLGFRANYDEGKVMGLAAYGKPAFADGLRELVDRTEDGFRLDLRYFSYFLERERRVSDLFLDRFGPPRAPDAEIEPRHRDMAASLQLVTEEILLHLCAVTRRMTGMENLSMAGGVTLNCVANGRIARESGFSRTFFQPAAGDAGTSLGAALWVTHGVLGAPRRFDLETVDTLGVEYTEEEVERELRRVALPTLRLRDPAAAAADLLAAGCIVGWFQGRAEFGPRALGNRSILADPRRADMKDIVNRRVKFREPFRPFAPSVLAERVGDLFTPADSSPFMLRAHFTREDRRDIVPAVTHVDGTARLHTVTRTSNPLYYRLIEEFDRRTGVPCVLNTSFNLRGEPIVNSVTDAVKCWAATDMDALIAGPFALARSETAAARLRDHAP